MPTPQVLNLKEQLQKKEEEAQQLANQYNQTQRNLNTFGQEMLKLEGAISQLKELIELDKKEK